MWNEITYRFTKCNGATVEIWIPDQEFFIFQRNKINEQGNNTYITKEDVLLQSYEQYSHNRAI